MNSFTEKWRIDDSLDKTLVSGLKKARQKKNLILSVNDRGVFSNSARITQQKEDNQVTKCRIKNCIPVLLTASEQTDIKRQKKALRLANDDMNANNTKQHTQKRYVQGLAQIQAIMQDYPEMMKQSIQYLTTLMEQVQSSGNAQSENAHKFLTNSSITRYYTQLYLKGSTISFFDYSTALLKNRLLAIIQEFKKFQPTYPSSIRIQIQILAYFFKIALQFQQYFPQKSQKKFSRKLKAIIKILKLNTLQSSQLKQIYIEKFPQITYLEQSFNLRPLVNAYYFILLKQKVLTQVNRSIPPELIEKAIKKLKMDKDQAMKPVSCHTQSKEKYSLSEFHANSQRKQMIESQRVIETIETVQIYEKMLSLSNLGERGNQLLKGYYGRVDYQRFQKYQLRKKTLLEQHGGDLSGLKDVIITKLVAKNPNCSYKQIIRYAYRYQEVYIDQDYFDSNIQRLLTREAQYQQLMYLQRVFKSIDQRKEGMPVLFADCCSLTEEKQSSLFIAVTHKGTLIYRRTLGSMHVLEEVQQFLKHLYPSIIILFDDQFPLKEEIQKQCQPLIHSRGHIILFLPRVSLIPNPCWMVAKSIGQAFREKLCEERDWEKAFQSALQQFKVSKVKEIMQKEWEKVQRLLDPNVHPLQQENGVIIKMEEDQESEPSLEVYYKRSEYVKEEEDDRNEESQLQEEPPSIHVTRSQGKEGIDAKSSPILPAHQIMENLKGRSANDLRLALTRLLQFNKKVFFSKIIQANIQ